MHIEAKFCCHIELGQGHITGFSVGPDHRLYVLVCLGRPENHIEREQECAWKVLSIDSNGEYFDYFIPKTAMNFSLVQPLGDGLLLATSRCRFAGENTLLNGHVFDLDGHLVRTILFGDGIQNVQATGAGSIWVSYFDEGVFGNLGWSEPIGSSGLLRFDDTGRSVFKFEPVAGLDSICDCYCLNVVNEHETWCCYYTDFPIVLIEDDRITGFWNAPVGGASGMAIWRDLVLMQGGYGSDDWELLRLTSGQRAEIIGSYEPRDRFGQTLTSRFSTCRGDAVWFLDASNVYHMAVRELPV